MTEATAEIQAVIDGWAVWRDSGDWDRLRAAWHPDGQMKSTWFRGSKDDFVDAARESFENGAVVHHFLGGTSIEVAENRAVAQTKMTISQRLLVHDVLVDITATGRFYDLFELRDGRWRMVVRSPIYEKDRLDPVSPAEFPELDKALLESFPAGCRHLLYSQTLGGLNVFTDLPGLRGPEVEQLYAEGSAWLQGDQP